MIARNLDSCYDSLPTSLCWEDFVIKTTCSHCGSRNAWFKVEDRDIVLRCLCGMHKVVKSYLDNITIEHTEEEIFAKLPKRNSRLYRVLAVLYAIEPAQTSYITEMMGYGRKDEEEVVNSDIVSSQLTVLKYRKMVKPLDKKKGIVGGSTWVLTDRARQMFEGGG